ncbi:16S rRNA (guanine(966)-N(2))-methyltransferase RsmD [Cumulibacter soli]|uniref:16S rRNA (guanine(966)-N(2))-methyltransferase RsmD n=1 Tax=Cumulibacter soli TaxID=2546344 RepID=UPI001068777F|nr:16S rRNA (guanine(966)-N(2))-methyltransferase RsmD [Cumulibacter soli]
MSRIIAGEFGGRRLATPSGRGTRPTSDRTREALFSSLAARVDLADGPFLDLYAGSGAVGLEALSRGAPRAVLVESAKEASRVIAANVRELRLEDRAQVITSSVSVALAGLHGLSANVVFLDPPYADDADEIAEHIRRILNDAVIDRDGLLVLERDRRSDWDWPDGIEALNQRRYGETVLWYGRPL